MILQLLITTGSKAGKAVRLAERKAIIIGSGKGSHLVLKEPGLAARHCRIKNVGNCCRIEAMDEKEPTLVNEVQVRDQEVFPGDEIRMGTLVLVAEEVIEESAGERQAAERRSREELSRSSDSLPAMKSVESTATGSTGFSSGQTTFVERHKFCASCGCLVPRRELREGRARAVGDMIYCPACADPYLGKTLGNYRLVSKVGEGAMGVVFRGENEMLGRVAAVKILFEYLTVNPKVVQRFLREAKASARLSHPNLVSLYDAGEAEGLYYLILEFVDGPSLERRIQEGGPPPLPVALEMIDQVAAALEYAHECGLVHRDVKPANVLLDCSGPAKLIDLGTAKSTEDSGLGELTKTGMGIGTINFMAPEQIFDAKNVDSRADVYGLGATLYYALAGCLPFDAKTPTEFLTKIHTLEVEPPQVHNAALPDTLTPFLRKCMAKERENRFGSMTEVRQALNELRSGWTRSA